MELHDFQFFTLETLIIQSVILFIVLWVLNKFLFKPYLAYIDEWNKEQQKLKDDYENIDSLLKKAEADKEDILKNAKIKADEIIKDAENIAKQKKSSILESAETEAKSILEAWNIALEKEKLSMLNWVKSNLIDIVLKFNKTLFSSNELNKDFVEKQIALIK